MDAKGVGRAKQRAHTVAVQPGAGGAGAQPAGTSPFGSIRDTRIPTIGLTEVGTQALLQSSPFGRATSHQPAPPAPKGEAATWATPAKPAAASSAAAGMPCAKGAPAAVPAAASHAAPVSAGAQSRAASRAPPKSVPATATPPVKATPPPKADGGCQGPPSEATPAKAVPATDAAGGAEHPTTTAQPKAAADARDAVPAPAEAAARPTPKARDSPEALSDREFQRILTDVHMTLLQMRLLCNVLHQYPGTGVGGLNAAIQVGVPAPTTAEQSVQTRIRHASSATQTEDMGPGGADAAGPMRAAGSGEDPRGQAAEAAVPAAHGKAAPRQLLARRSPASSRGYRQDAKVGVALVCAWCGALLPAVCGPPVPFICLRLPPGMVYKGRRSDIFDASFPAAPP